MFEDLESILQHAAPLETTTRGEPTSRDALVATVALLLEVADTTDNIGPEEFQTIVAALCVDFSLTEAQTGELIEIANFLRRQPGMLAKFLPLITEAFNLDQRQRILAMVWRVFISDGVINEIEAKIGARLRAKLELTAEAAMGARMMAEQQDMRMLAANVSAAAPSEEEED